MATTTTSHLPISPVIPKEPLELLELKEDLERMGCLSLLDFCWSFCVESTIQEMRRNPLPQPEGDGIRACPEKWTMGRWQEVYGFPRQGGGWTSLKKEEYAKACFSTKDAKNGYSLQDCTDPRAKRVFAFLVPILHPEKPARITVTLANTVYGCFLGERMVNWAIIMREVVLRLVKGVNNNKRTPLCPFLIHLYHHFKETTAEEDIAYGTQLMLKKFDGTESEPELGSEGGSSSSQSEEEALPPPKRQRQRQGGAPSSRTRAAVRAAATGPAQLGGKTYPASALLEALRVYVDDVDRTLGQVSGLVGNPSREGLVAAVKEKVGGAGDLRMLEQKVTKLTTDLAKMKSRALEAEGSCKEALLQANASAAALSQVEEALYFPADAVAKAKMFDAKLERDGHVSSKRVIAFMVEQTVKLEEAYANMKVLVGNLTHTLPAFEDDFGGSGSETDSGGQDLGDQGEPKVVVLPDSPDIPPQAPPLGASACLSPSELTTQVQDGGRESTGVTREPSPKTTPRPPPRDDFVRATPPVVPLSVPQVGKTTSESSAFLRIPVATEDKSGHSSGQEVFTGTPRQVPASLPRPGLPPGITSVLLTPGGPGTSLTSRESLPVSSTPGVASSVNADLASTLVSLATAAAHPSSSKSAKKRKRKEEKRRLEERARK